MKNATKVLTQRALEDLQGFCKRSDIEIEYKAELAKARQEKCASVD